MNQSEHVDMIIKDLKVIIEQTIEEYNIPMYMPLEKCISNEDIEDLFFNDNISIYDQLNGNYKKSLKSFFSSIKKINFLGNPKFYYYKNNTIKINSDILRSLYFDGKSDSISNVIKKYLSELENYLRELDFIKYVQYIIDIKGLELEVGKEKLTLEEDKIIITYPFDIKDVDNIVDLIKPKLKNKKMEMMSFIILLRKINNEMYIPQKYEEYCLPEIFDLCLDNFYINSITQSKYVKVYYRGEFIKVYYLSAYEFMNNKINKPFCYFYVKNNQLLDEKTQNEINKIIKLQDSLE